MRCGGVRVVKEEHEDGTVKEDSPGRKCQTFAMCGTGSDSKAAARLADVWHVVTMHGGDADAWCWDGWMVD
jgi:hypothetical protein